MEDNFWSARLNSTRINNYALKQQKNKSAKAIVTIYLNNKGEITQNLRTTAFLYNRICSGILDTNLTEDNISKITDEQINDIFLEIKSNADKNFIRFYESYRRKIDKGYTKEFVCNALSDLKTAYATYRKLNNSSWNLQDSQITENEMTNLYNILTQNKQQNSNSKQKEEK